MRTIEEIMAAMNAIMTAATGRNLTDDEVTQYEELEAELADVQRTQNITARHAARAAVQPAIVPAAGPRAEVREPLPYRCTAMVTPQGVRNVFAPGPEGYDFSTDLLNVINQRGDIGAANVRLNAFITDHFERERVRNDVEREDFDDTNPIRYRPDLWQPQTDYVTPLWNMVDSGPTDGTPFYVPKFSSASGMVGPATEKVEPAGGSMVVTDQAITPTQVWGKVEITRQAARRQGSPAMSGIIWDQMLREYYEEREAAVATFLNTLTAAADIALPGVDASPSNDEWQANAAALEAAIIGLQFVRGGNRFRAFAVHEALYKGIASVQDDQGRPLYPQIGPSNANGTAAALWTTMNIGGTLAVPAWALGAAGGSSSVNSWLFDPSKVRGWADQPERLEWNFGATIQDTDKVPQLSYVTIGIYGNIAFANLDIAGVRQVIFDQNTAA